MIVPASMGDWMQGVAVSGLVAIAGTVFAGALREEPVTEPVEAPPEERERDLVGSAAG
jgi:hypothetical protein